MTTKKDVEFWSLFYDKFPWLMSIWKYNFDVYHVHQIAEWFYFIILHHWEFQKSQQILKSLEFWNAPIHFTPLLYNSIAKILILIYGFQKYFYCFGNGFWVKCIIHFICNVLFYFLASSGDKNSWKITSFLLLGVGSFPGFPEKNFDSLERKILIVWNGKFW